MNDRLKFRTWDKEINKFRYGDVSLGCNGKPFVITCDPKKPIEYLDNVEVNFCTGFKDRNGKLIYEGDIVKNAGYILETIYKVGFKKGAFFLENDDVIAYFHELRKCFAESRLEIIGNIYTTPELLEEQC